MSTVGAQFSCSPRLPPEATIAARPSDAAAYLTGNWGREMCFFMEEHWSNSLKRNWRDKNPRDPKGSLDYARDFACGFPPRHAKTARTGGTANTLKTAQLRLRAHQSIKRQDCCGASLRKTGVGSVREGPGIDAMCGYRVWVELPEAVSDAIKILGILRLRAHQSRKL